MSFRSAGDEAATRRRIALLAQLFEERGAPARVSHATRDSSSLKGCTAALRRHFPPSRSLRGVGGNFC